MPEEEVGKISDYFAKIGVAAIELTGTLSVGDTIHIKGHTTDFTQNVDSIQIEHQQVEKANPGDSIGIKVKDRVRDNDIVYKVTEE
ncbi:MAG: translation elongation factor-like protein [candidate division Zixibacteria bacterium SM23_73_2]|nr:MAG: translation elongation factor-like protein [candidate division Zixibacteria bacterium SM23_73_2]